MPSVVCPCCKATNETGPLCRRCKCDLALLFRYAEWPTQLQAEAVQHLLNRNFSQALARYTAAKTQRAARS